MTGYPKLQNLPPRYEFTILVGNNIKIIVLTSMFSIVKNIELKEGRLNLVDLRQFLGRPITAMIDRLSKYYSNIDTTKRDLEKI